MYKRLCVELISTKKRCSLQFIHYKYCEHNLSSLTNNNVKHYLGVLCSINRVGFNTFQLPSTINLRTDLPRRFSFNKYSQQVHAKNEDSISLDQCDKTEQEGKVFVESENIFHHQVLESSDIYSSTIYKYDPSFGDKYKLNEDEYNALLASKDWTSQSIFKLAESVISIGVYNSKYNTSTTINDPRFNSLILAFVEKSKNISDDQLIDCLVAIQYWPRPKSVKEDNFLLFWKALDSICFERHLEWTIDKKLFFIDLWYQINLPRLSFFVYKGLCKISRKCEDLTRAQMMQTLFYVSCLRKVHSAVSLREYEYYIQKYITDLSIEEIGIVALAFFKTQTTIINQKILLYIMQRVVKEMDTINQMTLSAIAKVLRFSHKPEIAFTANDLVKEVVEKRIESLSMMNTIHILHISTRVQFFNAEAITKLAEKFCSDPSAARLKDMERVMFVLSLFNYIPPSTPNIMEIICGQLDKEEHVNAGKNHHLTLLSLVYYLSIMNVFPEKHIRYLLSEETLKSQYENRFRIDMQVVQLDYNRVLEGPEGSQHLLNPETREYLGRRHSFYVPNRKFPITTLFDRMFFEIIELSTKVLGGEQYYVTKHALPHFPRADLLFHLSEEGKPLPIPADFRNQADFHDVLRAPDPTGWYCVVVGGRNMFMHNVPKLVGEQVAKLRQLRLLGYTPIVIPAHYWRGEKDKSEYLKLKYFTRVT